MKRTLLALLTVLAFLPQALAQSGAFPNRALRMIVPFAPGSAVDANGRFFAEQLAGVLGQPVVVENRPGADGAIGITAVKTAPADGHTLLLASNSTLTVNPLVIKDLPYDPMKELKPISGLTRGMTVFVVPAESRFNTLAELVAAMKQAPAPMNVGTYSTGYRLAIEWFTGLAGVRFNNVPYKGAAPMFQDAVGGRLDWAVTDLIGASELLKGGKLKAIAVSGLARHDDFPDVPTIRESGYPDYVNYTWSSLYVRAETPDDVTQKLGDALQKAFRQQAVRDFVKRAKLEPMQLGPMEMRRFQVEETARLKRLADAAGIKPE